MASAQKCKRSKFLEQWRADAVTLCWRFFRMALSRDRADHILSAKMITSNMSRDAISLCPYVSRSVCVCVCVCVEGGERFSCQISWRHVASSVTWRRNILWPWLVPSRCHMVTLIQSSERNVCQGTRRTLLLQTVPRPSPVPLDQNLKWILFIREAQANS